MTPMQKKVQKAKEAMDRAEKLIDEYRAIAVDFDLSYEHAVVGMLIDLMHLAFHSPEDDDEKSMASLVTLLRYAQDEYAREAVEPGVI